MTGPISPEQLQQLLAGYVLYDLSPEESAMLAELLVANPALQNDIDQLQESLEVAYDGEPVRPPAHLRAALLQSAAQLGEPERVQTGSPAALTPGPRRWGRIWAAAAAAVIAGLSVSNLMLWRTLQLERASQSETETITIVLGASGEAALGQAQVVINPDTLVGSLSVENLPPLEPGTVYVLWTVVDPRAPVTVDEKNAILTTVFTVDGEGRVSQPIDLPPVYRRDRDLVRAVAITKESAAAPQEHLSPPLLIQPL
ncbi:anti-sigma factor domain-containing protein [Nodosilinea sp. PGN35]|uniref:anti-sigma factor n=1 Tax=Nodosilinea sp. PGN35 TaxID=3020489 RepID=UPI0023B23932|nr:anti-sigma factor [Nodosilinea sp. TSF1-S3]MDF0369286.1 anti-sigma factor [Nodosilinea sp. TSF1-S3]